MRTKNTASSHKGINLIEGRNLNTILIVFMSPKT